MENDFLLYLLGLSPATKLRITLLGEGYPPGEGYLQGRVR